MKIYKIIVLSTLLIASVLEAKTISSIKRSSHGQHSKRWKISTDYRYEGMQYNKSTANSQGNMNTTEQKLKIGTSFSPSKEHQWSFHSSANLSQFNKEIELEKSNTKIPTEFLGIHFKAGHRHTSTSGKSLSTGVSVSSVTEKPFQNNDDIIYGISTKYKVPRGKNAWIFGINYSYSKNSSNIPFPIASYSYNPNSKFQALIGIPMTITYSPTDKLKLSAMYAPARTVMTKASYSIYDKTQLYAGFVWKNPRSYKIADREDKESSIFLDEKRYFIGGKTPLSDNINLDLGTSYLFDRTVFEGKKYSKRSSDDLNLKNEIRLLASLSISF
ncbi:MAG: hypothetical protein KAQ98_14065 [Bacteriovoracaceae bacterium]|nr:hypothetical protein [Bacteriovoracaceae bacterium]